jgi:ATP diphosphatase
MSDFPGLRGLLEVMRRLRDPTSGCSWDLAQDGRSLARYTLEEAHELVDALEAGATDAVRDELGDLLFQVVFHAQLAVERGDYDFDAVAAGIAAKLTRRHPHVFGEGAVRGADAAQWETIKAAERGARGVHGVLDDVPISLPALTRATKLGKRAATVGFDWPDAVGARAKVMEELAEVDAATAESPARVAEEIGDLLLAVTSLARHLRVDPETALRQANQRFESRFRRMEAAAAQRGWQLAALSPAEWDSLWEEVKRDVQS